MNRKLSAVERMALANRAKRLADLAASDRLEVPPLTGPRYRRQK